MGCHCLLHMDYYSTIKQNEMLPLATMWMDLECIMFSEISQVEKDRLTDTENKLVVTSGERGEKRGEKEVKG